MTKILYLEDDINLSDTISEYLQEQGFELTCTFDSDETLCRLYEEQFDLLILDVNLPDMSGFELLKELKKSNNTIPSIFTTSLNSIEELEIGYKIGCDDYLKKPFALKELLLRINAILKKTINNSIKMGSNITFDSKNLVLIVDDIAINLKPKELKLLKLLATKPNQIVRFDEIFDYVWDIEENPSDMSLRTYIKNLRKIIGKDKIISIKKQGYKLEI